jgi:transcriptional antiterminator RfaH
VWAELEAMEIRESIGRGGAPGLGRAKAAFRVGGGLDEEEGWYCVQTRPKGEHIAAAHLRQLHGVSAFCPRLRFQRGTRRGQVWFVEALFPGYVFARFVPATMWRAVQHAHGVARLLEFGGRYPLVDEDVIEALRSEMGDDEVREVKVGAAVGDEVELASGALRGLAGVITKVLSGGERVRVLMEFLGEQRLVEVRTIELGLRPDPRAGLGGGGA